jgi:4-hydroxythreonine-4-phosphate dehydrogenase
MKPTIALVQGDPTGIGPELMAKLLALDDVRDAANIAIFSDRRVFEAGCRTAGISHDVPVIEDFEEADFSADPVWLIDLPAIDPETLTPGRLSRDAGAAVLTWFGVALDLCAAGVLDGLCFMPFNKDAMHQAGLDTEDETQWARKHIGHDGRVSEFNVIDGMWNARVTSHVPHREVAGLLSVEEIVASIELADRTLKAAGFARPRIAVAALNPHGGDGGNIGREEIDIIAPAVEKARALQIGVEGPFPSDTLYIKVRDGQYDCAVSMYHDQGQIAIKLLGFHMGVSVLSGLPFPMATPAHGTAFDIVGSNKANIEPARRAFLMVAEMGRNRGGAVAETARRLA